MGAGAAKQQVHRGTRSLLAGKQRELAGRGVRSTYRLGAVTADNGEYWIVRVLRASNGETMGILVQVKETDNENAELVD